MRRAAQGSSGEDDAEPRVVIVDLGSPAELAAGTAAAATAPQIRGPRRLSKRTRAGVAGVVLVALVGIAGDTYLSSERPRAEGERRDVCAAIRAQQERGASGGIFLNGLNAEGMLGPAASSTLMATVFHADPQTGRSSLLAFVDSDELWEFCVTQAEATAAGTSYLGEDELGELPEGMTYVYRNDPLNGEYSVAGIRLPDGFVVDSLTLRDGRTVPQGLPAE